MSIVSISNGVGPSITRATLKALAEQLKVGSIEAGDAEDYLTILRSFEAILRSIDNAPDYTPPELRPCPSTEPRTHRKPMVVDNPFNAWSYQCRISSSSPTSDLLKGRTVAVKDNVSVAGMPMTIGIPEPLFPNGAYPISSIDASVVSRILAAGGIITGTSTCKSFCASPLSFTSASGPVHNPRLRGYTAGGSSSGSSVLVASRALASPEMTSPRSYGVTVEMAIGSDQAGSVRIPASYNGIYGLKPTFGLVPYTGAVSMSPMIDHLGPLGDTLEDVTALLEVMAGYDGFDPRMTPESPLRGQVKPYRRMLQEIRERISSEPLPGNKFRVGLLTESFTVAGVSEDVRDKVRRTAREFFEAAGASVAEVSVPMHKEGPAIWTAATRPSMSSHLCQGNPSGHLSYLPAHSRVQWPPSQEMLDTLTANNPAVINVIFSELLARSTATGEGLEAKAHRKAFELRAAYNAALAGVDVLVTPCAPTVAMPHPDQEAVGGKMPPILKRLGVAIGVTSNTCPFNITGHPALNVPYSRATMGG
ncbi:glutamyl-tRNA amidotransferase subunit (amidase) [Colletotrichum plurivorum]|uniref:Glutamyl-tRNA amidotransferase subunit (Amidase) n=1 Tax=Colletotrichum plurivorum TaxID=2175906 RepID=A0A8H6JJF9_9PEZI|nr:glutamyl-tRNA amidotransferase subunit (amidase) [Colletotrichum plurivorum]